MHIPVPPRPSLRRIVRRRPLLLLLLALSVAFPSFPPPDAAAQTAPVRDDDRVFTQIAAGKFWTCGVTQAGYVRCWGHTGVVPVRSDTAGYVEVTGAYTFACGRRSSGVVNCWSLAPNRVPVPPTAANGDPITFSAISADQRHVCGILDGQNGQTAGLVRCWKQPSRGEGDDVLAELSSELAATTFGLVDAGIVATCALVKGGADDGNAKCWGWPGTLDEITPPDALKDTPFADIATGNHGACGIVRDGTEAGRVKCWGLDFAGEIDEAPETGAFSSVGMMWQHACALRTDGAPVCWGRDDYEVTTLPAELSGATFAQISVGFYHGCGILDGQNGQTAGTVKCWGGRNPENPIDSIPAIFDSGMTTPYGERNPLPSLSASPGAIDAGAPTPARRPPPGARFAGETRPTGRCAGPPKSHRLSPGTATPAS